MLLARGSSADRGKDRPGSERDLEVNSILDREQDLFSDSWLKEGISYTGVGVRLRTGEKVLLVSVMFCP